MWRGSVPTKYEGETTVNTLTVQTFPITSRLEPNINVYQEILVGKYSVLLRYRLFHSRWMLGHEYLLGTVCFGSNCCLPSRKMLTIRRTAYSGHQNYMTHGRSISTKLKCLVFSHRNTFIRDYYPLGIPGHATWYNELLKDYVKKKKKKGHGTIIWTLVVRQTIIAVTM